MANCFGDVVDNFKLDTMPRYVDEKKTQEDRAREASHLSNEGAKYDKASKYVRDLKAWYGNGVTTLCLIYNQTGATLQYVADTDWFGQIGPTPYPTEIGNGQWASFLHVKPTSAPSGSMAGLVYRGKDGNGRDCDFMLGWSTPWGASGNRAYCEIGNVGSFQSRLNNGDLEKLVNNADLIWEATDRSSSVRANITKGVKSPFFIAHVTIPFSP